MKIPVVGGVLPVIALRVTQAHVYDRAAQKKTDERQTTEAGAPMTRVTGLAAVTGDDLVDVTVELSDKMAASLSGAGGELIRVQGENLVAKVTGGDFGAVRATVTGAESAEAVAPMVEILAAH